MYAADTPTTSDLPPLHTDIQCFNFSNVYTNERDKGLLVGFFKFYILCQRLYNSTLVSGDHVIQLADLLDSICIRPLLCVYIMNRKYFNLWHRCVKPFLYRIKNYKRFQNDRSMCTLLSIIYRLKPSQQNTYSK
jgi:hypothetical protein